MNEVFEDNIYFVSGIDTGIGKSYATGYIANILKQQGHSVITQKFIQTGNVDYSEDIDIHRKIMNMEKTKEDLEFLTMPEIFSCPCSPHLASKIDKREIDLNKISSATEKLSLRYNKVLIEGAGGLMVPISDNYLTIDYISEKMYPLLFVTTGRLGSINHTLLSFEAIKNYKIQLECVIYNTYAHQKQYTEKENTAISDIISEDTLEFIKRYLKNNFPKAKLIILPKIFFD